MTIPTENPFKVRLNARGAQTIQERRAGVTFEVAPELNEARQVQYEYLDPVHAPGQIAVYKRTQSRRFQLTSVKLVSRTPAEASINLAYLWTLRGWTMPYFGKIGGRSESIRGSAKTVATEKAGSGRRDSAYINSIIEGISKGASNDYLGAPPQVLELSAYSRRGSDGINSIGHLYRVPVVIESLGILYPTDVDYIPTDEVEPTPMPTVMMIDIALVETQSPTQLGNFSLSDYRNGILGKTDGK